MKIIELPIKVEFNDQKDYIYPSLIESRGGELTLVDTGYPFCLKLIEEAIIKNHYQIGQLKNIIITHYDMDHIGSLREFKDQFPWINIIASDTESKYISGQVKSERLKQAEEMQQHMPKELQEFGKSFISQLKEQKHVSVDRVVYNGDLILDKSCEVVATPGHTSGHISLFFPHLNSVITGGCRSSSGSQAYDR